MDEIFRKDLANELVKIGQYVVDHRLTRGEQRNKYKWRLEPTKPLHAVFNDVRLVVSDNDADSDNDSSEVYFCVQCAELFCVAISDRNDGKRMVANAQILKAETIGQMMVEFIVYQRERGRARIDAACKKSRLGVELPDPETMQKIEAARAAAGSYAAGHIEAYEKAVELLNEFRGRCERHCSKYLNDGSPDDSVICTVTEIPNEGTGELSVYLRVHLRYGLHERTANLCISNRYTGFDRDWRFCYPLQALTEKPLAMENDSRFDCPGRSIGLTIADKLAAFLGGNEDLAE